MNAESASLTIAIIGTLVSAGIFVVALVTLNNRLKRDREEQQQLLGKELNGAIESFKKEVGTRIIAVDDKRREDVQALHARIYELENRTFASISERLGKVESEMSGVQSELQGNTMILRIIQEKYINEGSS